MTKAIIAIVAGAATVGSLALAQAAADHPPALYPLDAHIESAGG